VRVLRIFRASFLFACTFRWRVPHRENVQVRAMPGGAMALNGVGPPQSGRVLAVKVAKTPSTLGGCW